MKKFMCKHMKRIMAFILATMLLISGVLPTQNIVYADDDNSEDDKAGRLEHALTSLVLMTSLGTYAMLGKVAGRPITIEDLIFNRYDKTSLNIFDNMTTNAPANSYLSGAHITGSTGVLNDVYDFFNKIALMAYMVILVYMGIRILLGVGGQKSAKYKELIMYWIQGVLILCFFPYVIKYTIALNDAFVQFIDQNKGTVLTTIGDNFSMSGGVEGNYAGGMSVLTTVMNSLSSGLIEKAEGSNPDYFAKMFYDATVLGWLAYGICWCVMVKQLVSLFIMYIKRMFITVFLIAVFPLVTISYAIDKIGDGKSQAFSNWYKEFALNIFLQTFQAIIYVIGAALIFAIGDGATGSPTDNWIILIMIITFISKGDEMLRAIFHVQGGGGETVGSLGKTMVKAAAAKQLVGGARKFVSSKVGEGSAIRNMLTNRENVRSLETQNRISEANIRAAEIATSLLTTQLSSVPTAGPQASPQPAPQPAAVSAPRTVDDMINDALSETATDEEREAAINELLEIYNQDPDAWKEIEDRLQAEAPERLAELKELMQVQAAINAIRLNVNLNENVELILKQRKNTKNKKAQRLAAALGYSDEQLKRIKELNGLDGEKKPKFKKPEAATQKKKNVPKKYTRKTGNAARQGSRYAGVTPDMLPHTPATPRPKPVKKRFTQKVKEGAKAAPKAVWNGVKAAPGAVASTVRNRKQIWRRAKSGVATTVSNARDRLTTRVSSRLELRRYENSAIAQVRKVNRLNRDLAKLRKQGKTGTTEYVQKMQMVNFYNSDQGALAKLKKRRAQFAERGIYFNGVGKTQRKLNRQAVLTRGKTAITNGRTQVAERYKAVRTNMKNNREASRSAKRVIELRRKGDKLTEAEKRELDQRLKFIKERKGTVSVLRGTAKRPGGTERVRMTRAQRKVNRDINRTSVSQARAAVANRKKAAEARRRGDVEAATRFDLAAQKLQDQVVATRKTTIRSYNPRADRRTTRAQRIMDQGYQKLTISEYRKGSKRVKAIERQLRVARANGQATENLVNELAAERATQATAYRMFADTRASLKKKGVKLSMPRDRVTAFVREDTARAYERTTKVERSSNRRLQKIQSRVIKGERVSRRNEVMDALETDSSVAPIRFLARKANERRRASAKVPVTVDSFRSKLEEEAIHQKGVSDDRRVIETFVQSMGIEDQTTRSGDSRFFGVIDYGDYKAPRRGPIQFAKDTVVEGMAAVSRLSPEVMEMARAENFRQSDERRAIVGIRQFIEQENNPAPPVFDPTSTEEPTIIIGEATPEMETAITAGNVIKLNTYEEEKQVFLFVDEMEKQAKERKRAEGGSTTTEPEDGTTGQLGSGRAKSLAAAIVVINGAAEGKFTVAETLEAITVIRSLQRTIIDENSNAYKDMQVLLGKLNYSLDDFEATTRIEVLNDPTLLAASDPNRDRIIDESVAYVKRIPRDDILLTMLDYDVGDLEVGYTPVAIESVTIAPEQSAVQEALQARISEERRKIELRNEAIDAERSRMALNAAAFAADLAFVAPAAIAGGLISAGLGSGSKGSPISGPIVAGFGTMTTVNNATSTASKWTIGKLSPDVDTAKVMKSTKSTVVRDPYAIPETVAETLTRTKAVERRQKASNVTSAPK